MLVTIGPYMLQTTIWSLSCSTPLIITTSMVVPNPFTTLTSNIMHLTSWMNISLWTPSCLLCQFCTSSNNKCGIPSPLIVETNLNYVKKVLYFIILVIKFKVQSLDVVLEIWWQKIIQVLISNSTITSTHLWWEHYDKSSN